MTQPGMIGDGGLPAIPTPPQVFRYTATASPVPTAAGDGLTLVGADDTAPVVTPVDWPTDAPGTAHPCAVISPGAPVDTVLLWTGTESRKTLVATTPVRLYAAATAEHDDATRVVDLDLWVIRLSDL